MFFQPGDRVTVLPHGRSRVLAGRSAVVMSNDRQVLLRMDDTGHEKFVNRNELALCSDAAAPSSPSTVPSSAPRPVTHPRVAGHSAAGASPAAPTHPRCEHRGRGVTIPHSRGENHPAVGTGPAVRGEPPAGIRPTEVSVGNATGGADGAPVSVKKRDVVYDLEHQLRNDSAHLFTELAAAKLPTSVHERLNELASQASPTLYRDVDSETSDAPETAAFASAPRPRQASTFPAANPSPAASPSPAAATPTPSGGSADAAVAAAAQPSLLPPPSHKSAGGSPLVPASAAAPAATTIATAPAAAPPASSCLPPGTGSCPTPPAAHRRRPPVPLSLPRRAREDNRAPDTGGGTARAPDTGGGTTDRAPNTEGGTAAAGRPADTGGGARRRSSGRELTGGGGGAGGGYTGAGGVTLSTDLVLAAVGEALRQAAREVAAGGSEGGERGGGSLSPPPLPPPRFLPLTRPLPVPHTVPPSGIATRCRMLPQGSIPNDTATIAAHTDPLIGLAVLDTEGGGAAPPTARGGRLGVRRGTPPAGISPAPPGGISPAPPGGISPGPPGGISPVPPGGISPSGWGRGEGGARGVSCVAPPDALMSLAREWNVARRAKDYAAADAIRAELRGLGYEPDALLIQGGAGGGGGGKGGATGIGGGDRGGVGTLRGDPSASGGGVDWVAAEALGAEWAAAKEGRNWDSADAIRAEIRRMGLEPEDVVGGGRGGGSRSVLTAEDGAVESEPPAHVNEGRQLTPHLHEIHHLVSRRGVTGTLLTTDYKKIEELPPEYGFTVVSQKWGMSPAAAAALQAQEAERHSARSAKQPEFVNPLCPPAEWEGAGAGGGGATEWPEPEPSSSA